MDELMNKDWEESLASFKKGKQSSNIATFSGYL